MMVEVTQADREAVASYFESVCDYSHKYDAFRRGEEDWHPLLQAIATHRIQSTAALQSELAAKDAEIERLRGLLVQSRWYVQDSLESHEHSDGRDILNAIDAELRQELGDSHV